MKISSLILICFFVFFLLMIGCVQKEQQKLEEQKSDLESKEGKKEVFFNMKITSSVFKHNGKIPRKYTCQGEDINPPLEFLNIPEGTKSFALIVDDPDAPAGVWVHWLLWNIKPETKEIKEDEVPEGAKQGLNDFRKHEYGGPCPPSGTHRYFFKLYALDTILNINENSKKSDLENAMKGHIIEKAELIGLYAKE